MRIAAFLSHPIQHLTPMWQKVSATDGVYLKVFYYSRQAVDPSYDPEFGVKMSWDVDFLAGHEHEFLPRQWPTVNPVDYTWKGLNRNLGKVLRDNWDVVYVGGYVHLNNWRVARTCRRLGIPLMCHSDASIITAVDKQKSKRLFKRLIVPRFIRRVDACLAIGDNSREYFLYYGARPEDIFFCPVPVDMDSFRRAVAEATEADLANLRKKYGIPDGKRIITFSGKLVPRKRPQDLIEALRRMDRDDVVGLIIGEGPLRSEIEQSCKGRAVVTGFVNQSEIPLLTSLGTISVMPSSYDAHPLAVTEALCLGVPVVLSDRCGCFGPNDVLRDGEDGFLYRCGDVAMLASKLTHLLDHEDVRARMSERAKQLADTQSPKAASEGLLNAAEHLVNGKK